MLLLLQAGLWTRNVIKTVTQSATASQICKRPRIVLIACPGISLDVKLLPGALWFTHFRTEPPPPRKNAPSSEIGPAPRKMRAMAMAAQARGSS